jgi:predicted nuclease of predicted toxin-antitoxin system
MKILLDESLPRKLKKDFSEELEVWNVQDMSWLGKKNGDLLRLMTENNFDLFITVDKNLPFQQNLKVIPLTIAVLRAKDNRRETLQVLIPKVFHLIQEGKIKQVLVIS